MVHRLTLVHTVWLRCRTPLGTLLLCPFWPLYADLQWDTDVHTTPYDTVGTPTLGHRQLYNSVHCGMFGTVYGKTPINHSLDTVWTPSGHRWVHRWGHGWSLVKDGQIVQSGVKA